MKEITLDAVVENIPAVTEFIDAILEEAECPMKAQVQIDIAIDEIFSNIAHYAYKESVGQTTIRVEITDEPKDVHITFIDSGVPYNPLEKPDPDTTLDADERNIGGLGIFMVKKNMDEMHYEYVDGKNQLEIVKLINS